MSTVVLPHLTSLAPWHKDMRSVLPGRRDNSSLPISIVFCGASSRCYAGRPCEPVHELHGQHLYLRASAARAVVAGTPEGSSLYSSASTSLRVCCPWVCPTLRGAWQHCPPPSPLIVINLRLSLPIVQRNVSFICFKLISVWCSLVLALWDLTNNSSEVTLLLPAQFCKGHCFFPWLESKHPEAILEISIPFVA